MLVLPVTSLVQRIAHLGVVDGQRPGLLNRHALGITKPAHKTIRASMNMRAYKAMLRHEVYHTGLTPVVALLWPLYDNYSTIKHSFFRGQDKVVPELAPYGAVLLYASLCSRVPTVKPLPWAASYARDRRPEEQATRRDGLSHVYFVHRMVQPTLRCQIVLDRKANAGTAGRVRPLAAQPRCRATAPFLSLIHI